LRLLFSHAVEQGILEQLGDKSKLAVVIGTSMDAVKAGELVKALLAAKKERAALMRKKAYLDVMKTNT
jgi:hypothetical protein